jgi:hypothetical protein
MILCLRRLGKRYNNLAKKRRVQMGMIAVLHLEQLSLHPHLHCIVPGGGVDKESNGKIVEVMVKFLFPVKALSKVLERSFRKLKTYKIRANKTRFMEETLGFCQETIWKHKVCGGIFGYTHKIAITR